MKKHKWSANNIAFGSGGVLPELSSLLQMLMISLLHAKSNFAQFSAAYLRHIPWGTRFFFSHSAGCFSVAGIRP